MRLAELTQKWLDTPYAEVSCIGFAHAFLSEATGKAIPDAFEDFSIDNYYDRWREDPRAVEEVMCNAVRAYTAPSNPKFPHLLDLLVVQIRGGGMTPAVYVGKGNAIASFIQRGVCVFGLDNNNQVVIAGSF